MEILHVIKRKKDNTIKDKDYYKKRFNEENLSCVMRKINWELSYPAIRDDDNVLIQGNYKLETNDDKGWYGVREFHFYMLENKGKKYLKLFDVLELEKQFDLFGNLLYTEDYKNIPVCEEQHYGIYTPEYRKKVRELAHEFKLDDNIDRIIKEMSKVNFDDYFLEDFTCDYRTSQIHYDCYDFTNKTTFVADGYCLKKYSPYIDLLDYVFTTAHIDYLVPSAIKKVDNFDEAYKKMVETKEKNDMYDLGMIYEDEIE